MSVVGLDFGNESGVVAVARQRGIDVVLNDESKRETPALVCFGDKQRFLGTAGAASGMMNPKNTVSQIKRLIGRQFSDPELQRDIKTLPFSVTEGPDGYPLIHAQYLGEKRSFTPTQVLAMVLSDLKSIAEKNLNTAVVDCCIGIPVYFTDLQRRAVVDAATIAGLHPLRLIHETTATALAYGIYKTDLPENEQLNVAFIDIGHASMQVCIAGLRKGQLKILAHAFDRSLGGRDFDEVLFQYFADKFKTEYKIDVYQNARACLRLRAGCEKLKKVLSANPIAPLNIECLMDEKDVRSVIKRDEFEEISIPILERVKKPLEKALADAGLTVENIYAVEVVGSGSRVPAIMKILTDFFGKEPRRTMNASECVAKGAALECAILSPTFKVRDFQVNESFPFPIALSWKSTAPDSHSIVVFPKGNPIPSLRALTFCRAGSFTVDVQYADVSEIKAPPRISTYTIGPFQSSKGERAKVKVKVRLSLHGIVSVESATLLEEEEVEVEAPKKKVKTNIPVTELVYGGMSSTDVQKAVEKEYEMALQDRVMEETKDKKNAVESYVYDMRNKLNDKYHDFVTASEREDFTATLQQVEDWLYKDGEDETKGVYVAKLEELKKEMMFDHIDMGDKEKLLEKEIGKVPIAKEASKMDTDKAPTDRAPGSMILEGTALSKPVAEFKDVNCIDDFNFQVDGVISNSMMPSEIRIKYYDLCRSQSSYLHQNLLQGLNCKLIVGMISETVNIADAIRACRISSSDCRDNLSIWDKTLKAFQELGMKVGPLRERICKLEGLITRQELKQLTMYTKVAEKEKAEEEMQNMRKTLMYVNTAIKKLGDEIDSLKNNEIGLSVFFEEAASAPW